MLRTILTAFATLALAMQASAPSPESPDPASPRPIPVMDTVFLEEMTWMEIRDALTAGKTTAIVATGGIEQNGPYLATGKHNYVLRATTQAIARKLGNALVAPIVPFVPEGNIDPPSGHMRYPGTISVTESTYEALLRDICASLRTHGFTEIVLIGDSGGNQAERPGPYRIVSVGCGPAIDLELAIRWLPAEQRSRLAASLLDLDGDAVEHAAERLGKLLSADQITPRRDNLYRLTGKPAALELLDGADFLVCSGLFDYLPDESAAGLLNAFWQRLGKGGALLVGNFAPHNPTRAYMEWIGNWYLTYRTPDDLRRLAEQAGIASQDTSVGAERLGIDLFLCAEKKS